jgi:large subunit ribosomal protein L23
MTEKKITKKKATKKSVKKKTSIVGVAGRVLASVVLRRPYVTEKSHFLAQSGVYVFEVRIHATKNDIRKAVEELYGVNVVSVRTIRQRGEERRFGKSMGKTGERKKAMVKLKEGQSIEIFEGA